MAIPPRPPWDPNYGSPPAPVTTPGAPGAPAAPTNPYMWQPDSLLGRLLAMLSRGEMPGNDFFKSAVPQAAGRPARTTPAPAPRPAGLAEALTGGGAFPNFSSVPFPGAPGGAPAAPVAAPVVPLAPPPPLPTAGSSMFPMLQDLLRGGISIPRLPNT